MRFDTPLDDLFRTGSHVRVLRALFDLPMGFGVSAREVGRRAEVSHPTAAGTLASMADLGLVAIRRTARGDEYSLNREQIFVGALDELLRRERDSFQDLVSDLSAMIVEEAPRVQRAYLFGSSVWGEMTPTSDLDVAVVCAPADQDDVESAMHTVAEAVRRRYGNRLSVIVKSRTSAEQEASRKGARDRLWNRILHDGVPLPLPRKRTSAIRG
jgi:predicted nucleotidyltransferase